VTKVVKSQIARNTENKLVGWKVEGNVNHNSAISAADCLPVIGLITQGTSSQERIGDRIRPKRLKVSGVLSLATTGNNTSQNLYARIVILSQKDIRVGSTVLGGAVDTAHLLRPGYLSADQKSFDGLTMDLNEPVNRDKFRVYMDKVVKIVPIYTLTANQGTSPLPQISYRWSYTFKQLPAALTWDDGNGDWANNFAPFLGIGYAYSDGTSPDVVSTKLISNVNAMLEFEDA